VGSVRPSWWRVAFLAWTGFVWIGRVRNALGDQTLDGADRWGPLLLACSFLLPAAVLAVWTVGEWRGGATVGRRSASSRLLLVLVAWTTVVWVVRATDKAFGGDREPAFVAVHVVLAVISITLGLLALRGDRRSPAGRL
jgi:hypothetical protein